MEKTPDEFCNALMNELLNQQAKIIDTLQECIRILERDHDNWDVEALVERMKETRPGELTHSYFYPFPNERLTIYEKSPETGSETRFVGVMSNFYRSYEDPEVILADIPGGFTINISNPKYLIKRKIVST